jgi:Xaa-Pro aminopeptidase
MSDFDVAEFQLRLARAQQAMAEEKLDALLFCTEAEVRYFSGFRTLFWQSPTRPWFLIVPARGAVIAVVPAIGADLMGKTWVRDIRTWSSPHASDDGVSLLTQALKGFARVGLPMGPESSLRMPLGDFEALRAASDAAFVDCTQLVKRLRMVKSEAEIAILRRICGIGSAAGQGSFSRRPTLGPGLSGFQDCPASGRRGRRALSGRRRRPGRLRRCDLAAQ